MLHGAGELVEVSARHAELVVHAAHVRRLGLVAEL